jgi:hypothetical protein
LNLFSCSTFPFVNKFETCFSFIFEPLEDVELIILDKTINIFIKRLV